MNSIGNGIKIVTDICLGKHTSFFTAEKEKQISIAKLFYHYN